MGCTYCKGNKRHNYELKEIVQEEIDTLYEAFNSFELEGQGDKKKLKLETLKGELELSTLKDHQSFIIVDQIIQIMNTKDQYKTEGITFEEFCYELKNPDILFFDPVLNENAQKALTNEQTQERVYEMFGPIAEEGVTSQNLKSINNKLNYYCADQNDNGRHLLSEEQKLQLTDKQIESMVKLNPSEDINRQAINMTEFKMLFSGKQQLHDQERKY